MLMMYAIALLALTLMYVLTLSTLRKGIRNVKSGNNPHLWSVAVVVAARNEAEHIRACIEAILAQEYSPALLEVIIVNDRSQDDTGQIAERLAAHHPSVKVLHIRDTHTAMAPKKRAIALAIRHTGADIIVTTDADCRPGPSWLKGIMRHFQPEVGMVAGFTPYRSGDSHGTGWQKILALDYFSMASVAAAAAGLGYPVSCCGGNLAYRKSVYHQVGGFRNIAGSISGDDDLFLEQIREQTGWQIRYMTEKETYVPTHPPENFGAFCQQRIRYASKGSRYTRPVVAALFAVYSLNLMLVVGGMMAVFDLFWSLPALAAWLLKTTAERRFLITAKTVFDYHFDRQTFWLTAILHPAYITFAGLLGQFFDFHWKGERFTAETTVEPVTKEGYI